MTDHDGIIQMMRGKKIETSLNELSGFSFRFYCALGTSSAALGNLWQSKSVRVPIYCPTERVSVVFGRTHFRPILARSNLLESLPDGARVVWVVDHLLINPRVTLMQRIDWRI